MSAIVLLLVPIFVLAQDGELPATGVESVGHAAALDAADAPRPWHWQAGRWSLDARGLLTVDLLRYARDNEKNSGLETRRATVILEGADGDGMSFRVEPDFDGETTRHSLAEAWLGAELGATHRLRAGLVRTALGSEGATDPLDLPLVGVAFPAWLADRTGWGVALDGDPGLGSWWELAATRGGAFDRDGGRLDDGQIQLRWMAVPAPGEDGSFDGPYGGIGLAHGGGFDDPIHVETPFEQTIFTSPDLDGASARWINLELGFVAGSVRVAVEDRSGAVLDVPTGPGTEEDIDQIGAFSFVTEATLRGARPRWERGRWLWTPGADDAWPLIASLRYSNADIDRELFDSGITTYDPSTQEVRSFSAALSTWMDAATRLTFQWTSIIADHELSTFGRRNRDSSFALRFDRRFSAGG